MSQPHCSLLSYSQNLRLLLFFWAKYIIKQTDLQGKIKRIKQPPFFIIAVSSTLPALYLDCHLLHSGKQELEGVPPAWAVRNVHVVEQSLDVVATYC